MCAEQLDHDSALPSLQILQRAFLQQVGAQQGADNTSAGANQTCRLGQSKVLPEQTWQIYRRNYLEGHIAALSSTYTNTLAVVGSAYFRQLARLYVQQNTSQHGDLNQYGHDFADFIANNLPSLPGADNLAYLPDMARLDWAWFDMLRAPSGQADWLLQLQQIDPQHWPHLRAKPACKLVQSAFPIYQIWQLNEMAAAGTESTNPLALDQAESVLISRPQQVEIHRLSPAAGAFVAAWLAAPSRAVPLEAALEAALALDEEFDFNGTMQLLAQCHAIQALEISHA